MGTFADDFSFDLLTSSVVISGISEMFKTPVNERKRKSLFNDSSAGGQSTSVIEPSVLNTPEEPGTFQMLLTLRSVWSK